jgi:MFS family permease
LAFFGLSLLFSAVGSQISSVAVAWQVYEITNSPFQLVTGLFRALPVMVLSIPAGIVADRMDRRRLLIITQALAALLALALGLLTSVGQVRVWHIYAVTFLSGAISIFDAPARTAMIPALVPEEHLASAYALNITWRQTATLAGPFLEGVCISAFGGETLRDTLVQLITPDRLRGRVKSFDQVFMSAGIYIGHAQMGTAASFLGVPDALILGGCLGSAAVLLVAKYARSLRTIDT